MPTIWKELASARHATVGLEIVLSLVVGCGLGYLADQKFETMPYLSVLGTLYGVAAAVRSAHRVHKQSLRQLDEDDFDEASANRPAHFKRKTQEKDA